MMPAIHQNSRSRLLSVPYYTEGPVTDKTGNCYFTSLAGGVIFKMDADDRLSEWAKAACPNGQIILPNGDHLVCDSKLRTLSRFNENGDLLGHDMEGECGKEQIYVPNDLISDTKGGVYFTDSIRHEGKIGYISADGKECIVARNLDYPNGLALSNDGRFLFVAESYKNRILIFILKSPGEAYPFELFADLPQNAVDGSLNLPDGIKVDQYDNLWVAHYGMGAVQVLNVNGLLCDTIDTGIPLTSNLYLTDRELIVTGGYNEPGPGALLKIAFNE